MRADFQNPVLLATHDLEECFELAKDMVILSEGRIVQSGPPRKILEQPASVEVARLLGIANLFEAESTALVQEIRQVSDNLTKGDAATAKRFEKVARRCDATMP